VPDEPLVPEEPEVPLLPEVPEEPEVPDEPDLPVAPSLIVTTLVYSSCTTKFVWGNSIVTDLLQTLSVTITFSFWFCKMIWFGWSDMLIELRPIYAFFWIMNHSAPHRS